MKAYVHKCVLRLPLRSLSKHFRSNKQTKSYVRGAGRNIRGCVLYSCTIFTKLYRLTETEQLSKTSQYQILGKPTQRFSSYYMRTDGQTYFCNNRREHTKLRLESINFGVKWRRFRIKHFG
jgi:hypothetical protein